MLAISKKHIIFFSLCFFSISLFSANSNLVDHLSLLPKSAYKRIEKNILSTSKKIGTNISIHIVQDDANIAEENLADELLQDMADDESDYEGVLLLIVLDNTGEVSTLYLPSYGDESSKIISSKRSHYITDILYDLSLENEKYEEGIALFLEMLELFFEYGN